MAKIVSTMSGVNFINIKRMHISYERCFGSFYYVHVTGKKAAETTLIQKICAFNVDEIDGSCRHNGSIFLASESISAEPATDQVCLVLGTKALRSVILIGYSIIIQKF
jgi:hypothetical protein